MQQILHDMIIKCQPRNCNGQTALDFFFWVVSIGFIIDIRMIHSQNLRKVETVRHEGSLGFTILNIMLIFGSLIELELLPLHCW